jgi:phospholipid-binding lipoprotein MlaA
LFVKTLIAKRLLLAVFATVILGSLTGCATTANNPKDPYEGFNRAMFSVNEGIDVVVKPVAQGYDTVTPRLVKAGVGNFFGNIADVWTALNNFLQGKGVAGVSDFGRVLVNTTFGIAGLFDVASEMGFEKHSEDFGQTLGVWGVGDGSYLFWPVLGPRTMRDTFGVAVDIYADPVPRIDNIPVRNTLMGVRFIDTRAALLPADKVVEEAAFDKYSYIRDAYLQNRRSVIYDGNPPAEEP